MNYYKFRTVPAKNVDEQKNSTPEASNFQTTNSYARNDKHNSLRECPKTIFSFLFFLPRRSETTTEGQLKFPRQKNQRLSHYNPATLQSYDSQTLTKAQETNSNLNRNSSNTTTTFTLGTNEKQTQSKFPRILINTAMRTKRNTPSQGNTARILPCKRGVFEELHCL